LKNLSNQTKTPNTKALTAEYVKKSVKKNKPKTFHQRSFLDWEGKSMTLRSQTIRKATFSHSYEAGTSKDSDLTECPPKSEIPGSHERENCAEVTTETQENFANFMQHLAQSTSPDMAKFRLPMVYKTSLPADYYLDVVTGDAAIYNEDGYFWSYRKYDQEEIAEVLEMAKKSGTLKFPPHNQDQVL